MGTRGKLGHNAGLHNTMGTRGKLGHNAGLQNTEPVVSYVSKFYCIMQSL